MKIVYLQPIFCEREQVSGVASVGQEKLAIRGQATCDKETCSIAAVSQRMICGRKVGGSGVSRTKEPTSWPIAHQIERMVRRY